MSAIDKLSSFSGARCEDGDPLPSACLSYGDVREILGEFVRVRYALEGAERVLRIAASYNPYKWPTAGLRIHGADAKLWAAHARAVLESNAGVTGTFNALGEVCGYCECKRKPSNAERALGWL